MAARILLVGSVMMDLILRCKRAPEPSESVLGHDTAMRQEAKAAMLRSQPLGQEPRYPLMQLLAMMPMGSIFLIAGKKKVSILPIPLLKTEPIQGLWRSPWKTVARIA